MEQKQKKRKFIQYIFSLVQMDTVIWLFIQFNSFAIEMQYKLNWIGNLLLLMSKMP